MMKRFVVLILLFLSASPVAATTLWDFAPSPTINGAPLPSGTCLSFTEANYAAGTTYYSGCNQTSAANTTEPVQQAIMPFPVVVKNLYVLLNASPGTGHTVTINTRVDGATPANSPTCTISDAATTCSDTSNSATVAAGHYVDFQVVVGASASAARWTIGMGVYANP